MKIIFNFFILISLNFVFSQSKTLHVIDSIPLMNEFLYDDKFIDLSDIAKTDFSVSPIKISKYGVKNIDTLIFITTKAYLKRSDSVKKIPTTISMENKDRYWYLNGKKYTGNFIDYYYNGKIRAEGNFFSGKINGVMKKYYNSGVLSQELSFKYGVLDGSHLNFFENGKIKTESYYSNDSKIGKWNEYSKKGFLKKSYSYNQNHIEGFISEYYSTGKIKRQYKSDFTFYRDIKFWNIRNPYFYKGELLNYQKWSNDEEYLKSKKHKKSKKKINKLLKEEPNVDTYYIFKAFLYYIEKDYDEAIRNLKKAQELEPMNDFVKDRILIASIRKFEVENDKNFEEDVLSLICKKINKNVFVIGQNFEAIDLKRFINLCNQ